MRAAVYCSVVVVCLAGVLFTPALEAQTNTGVIVGTVSDPTGAVIPGATVTITQSEMQIATVLETNAVGNYVSTLLRAGPYEIRVEAQGFQTALRRGIVLHVNDRLQLNFILQPGAVAEVIEVTGGAPLLETQTGDVSSVIDSRAIVDLPLDGRNYIDLMLLAPGVLQAPNLGSNPREGRFTVNGNGTLQNYFVLNGVDNNSFTQNAQDNSPQVGRPAPDALREFKIQTRTYSAEFGFAMGAVINAEVKGGSNDLHGSAWLFTRQDDFNANTFFANRSGLDKGLEVRNQFGFAIGGPIWRDRTFWFFDYDDSHFSKQKTTDATVPTALERIGDFSQSGPDGVGIPLSASDVTNLTGSIFPVAQPCLNLIADPDPGNPGGQLLTGLNLGANRTDGQVCGDVTGAALIQLYPLPTGPGPNQFFGTPGIPDDQWSFDIRIDHQIGERDNIYGVYDRFDRVLVTERGAFENPLSPGGFSANKKIRTHVFALAWVHTFSPTVVNDARLGTNYVFSNTEPLAPAGNACADFLLKGCVDIFAHGLPPITVQGYEIIGTNRWRPQDSRSQVWQFIDNLSYLRGNHSFKFGLEFKRAINNFLDIRAPNGEFTIADHWTNNGVANLLLGFASGARVTSALVPHNYIDGTMFYGQDSWRVTPTFTFNYGVRYEYFTPMIERDRLVGNIDPTANGGLGALITAFPGPLPTTSGCTTAGFECLIQGPSGNSIFARTLVNPDRNNIAPRLSFAWQARDKIVLRGGYAIFYQVADRIGSGAILQLNPPQQFELSDSRDFDEPPLYLLRDGFPFVPTPPADIDLLSALARGLRGRDMNEVAPYSQQWSFGPQIELTPDLVLEVDYVGQVTDNVRRLRNLNQGILVTPGDTSSVVFPFPDWRDGAFRDFLKSDGDGNYHSLQINARKRFSHGLMFNAAYTWGKALGTGGAALNLTGGGGSSQNNPQNAHDLDADYGRLVFDQRQRFVVNWLWELPFGPGQPYLNQGLAAKLLGDWQFSGIWRSNSGVPIGIRARRDTSGTLGRSARADCIGDPFPSGFQRTVDAFFDTSAFAQPADGTFGNCGVASFSSWAHHQGNFSLFKKFRIDEERRFELRFEFFNVFNTPQFRSPGNQRLRSSFGKTESTARAFSIDARVIQLGAKFYF